MMTSNVKENVTIQTHDNINVIMQPDDKINVIIQQDDNINWKENAFIQQMTTSMPSSS